MSRANESVSGDVERAVDRYLRGLADPAALVDHDLVDSLRGQLAETDSPLERIRIRERIREALTPDPTAAEDAFVDVVAGWADANGVSAASLVAEGVPEKVLRRAGMSVTKAVRQTAAALVATPESATEPLPAATTPRKRSRRTEAKDPSAPTVTSEAVQQALADLEQPFTIRSVMDATGATRSNARRGVERAVDAGEIVRIGEDPKHTAQGRAPVLYQMADRDE